MLSVFVCPRSVSPISAETVSTTASPSSVSSPTALASPRPSKKASPVVMVRPVPVKPEKPETHSPSISPSTNKKAKCSAPPVPEMPPPEMPLKKTKTEKACAVKGAVWDDPRPPRSRLAQCHHLPCVHVHLWPCSLRHPKQQHHQRRQNQQHQPMYVLEGYQCLKEEG